MNSKKPYTRQNMHASYQKINSNIPVTRAYAFEEFLKSKKDTILLTFELDSFDNKYDTFIYLPKNWIGKIQQRKKEGRKSIRIVVTRSIAERNKMAGVFLENKDDEDYKYKPMRIEDPEEPEIITLRF